MKENDEVTFQILWEPLKSVLKRIYDYEHIFLKRKLSNILSEPTS